MSGYLSSLRAVKATFRDGKDKNVVAGAIAEVIPEGTCAQVLDVGIGDGTYVKKLRDVLEGRGISCEITGLDPLLAPSTSVLLPEATLWPLPLEEFISADAYDVVLSRQSLYYNHDWRVAVTALAPLTKRTGLAIVIVWSQDCILSRINGAITPEVHVRLPTAEMVYDYMRASKVFSSVEIKYCVGSVDLEAWVANPTTLSAGYEIASRRWDRTPIDPTVLASFRDLVRRVEQPWTRKNGVIIARR
jgi:SAM-dependent methyltransferase